MVLRREASDSRRGWSINWERFNLPGIPDCGLGLGMPMGAFVGVGICAPVGVGLDVVTSGVGALIGPGMISGVGIMIVGTLVGVAMGIVFGIGMSICAPVGVGSKVNVISVVGAFIGVGTILGVGISVGTFVRVGDGEDMMRVYRDNNAGVMQPSRGIDGPNIRCGRLLSLCHSIRHTIVYRNGD